MSNIFVVSDTHFQHEKIIGYANRPFNSVWDMDEALVDNWNSTVGKKDTVWHLGDVYMGTKDRSYMDKLLGRLHGNKKLVLGNHDDGHDHLLRIHFNEIVIWKKYKRYGVMLTHVPIHPWALDDDIRWSENSPLRKVNIHGHLHDKVVPNDHMKRYINVSVEQIGYKPVLLESLI
jgi:calcineurin-like phosphoesterase family protein